MPIALTIDAKIYEVQAIAKLLTGLETPGAFFFSTDELRDPSNHDAITALPSAFSYGVLADTQRANTSASAPVLDAELSDAQTILRSTNATQKLLLRGSSKPLQLAVRKRLVKRDFDILVADISIDNANDAATWPKALKRAPTAGIIINMHANDRSVAFVTAMIAQVTAENCRRLAQRQPPLVFSSLSCFRSTEKSCNENAIRYISELRKTCTDAPSGESNAPTKRLNLGCDQNPIKNGCPCARTPMRKGCPDAPGNHR